MSAKKASSPFPNQFTQIPHEKILRLRKLLNAVYLYIFHILRHSIFHPFVHNGETLQMYGIGLDFRTSVMYNIHVLDNAYRLPFASYDTSFLVGKDGHSFGHFDCGRFSPRESRSHRSTADSEKAFRDNHNTRKSIVK